MNPITGDRGISFLATALDGLAAQQQAIANNIANVDTPGYQRQSIPFAEMMRKAATGGGLSIPAGRPGHIPIDNAVLEPGAFAHSKELLIAGKRDGNTVEIEREITDLTENQLKYYAVAQAMSTKISSLRDIVTRIT